MDAPAGKFLMLLWLPLVAVFLLVLVRADVFPFFDTEVPSFRAEYSQVSLGTYLPWPDYLSDEQILSIMQSGDKKDFVKTYALSLVTAVLDRRMKGEAVKTAMFQMLDKIESGEIDFPPLLDKYVYLPTDKASMSNSEMALSFEYKPMSLCSLFFLIALQTANEELLTRILKKNLSEILPLLRAFDDYLVDLEPVELFTKVVNSLSSSDLQLLKDIFVSLPSDSKWIPVFFRAIASAEMDAEELISLMESSHVESPSNLLLPCLLEVDARHLDDGIRKQMLSRNSLVFDHFHGNCDQLGDRIIFNLINSWRYDATFDADAQVQYDLDYCHFVPDLYKAPLIKTAAQFGKLALLEACSRHVFHHHGQIISCETDAEFRRLWKCDASFRKAVCLVRLYLSKCDKCDDDDDDDGPSSALPFSVTDDVQFRNYLANSSISFTDRFKAAILYGRSPEDLRLAISNGRSLERNMRDFFRLLANCRGRDEDFIDWIRVAIDNIDESCISEAGHVDLSPCNLSNMLKLFSLIPKPPSFHYCNPNAVIESIKNYDYGRFEALLNCPKMLEIIVSQLLDNHHLEYYLIRCDSPQDVHLLWLIVQKYQSGERIDEFLARIGELFESSLSHRIVTLCPAMTYFMYNMWEWFKTLPFDFRKSYFAYLDAGKLWPKI